MEKKSEQLALTKALEPPIESHISTILNGIGNGMMVGTVPFIGIKLYADMVDKPIPKAVKFGGVFATIASCMAGAWYGKVEARRMNEYRKEVNEEITRLRLDVNANTAALQGSWSEKTKSAPEEKKEVAVTR